MKYLLLFSMNLILLTSCQREIVEVPDTGRGIVINGLITSDSLINVSITKSVYPETYLKGYDNILLDSAGVFIYQNDILVDSLYFEIKQLIYDSVFGCNSCYWSKNIYPVPGKEYKILVKRKGLPDAMAHTTIPNMPKIEVIDTARIKMAPDTIYNFLMNNDRLICNIGFTDPLFETNYYYFDIRNSYYEWRPYDGQIHSDIRGMVFETNDPVVDEKLNSPNGTVAIAFSDKLINGKRYKFTVSFYLSLLRHGYDTYNKPYKSVVYFRLYSITKEFFDYIQNFKLSSKNYNNPLAEPVMVNSNVVGGYGIFTGAAVSTDSIVFKY